MRADIQPLNLKITMPYQLINLTLPTVLQEIDDVLDEYPEHPYQSTFLIDEFRQKLIAYVFSYVPNHYTIAGEPLPARSPSSRNFSALAERLHLGMVIRGGILHILRENADRLSDTSLQTKQAKDCETAAA